ncbi:MAG: type 1 glutamine amidotransferase [Candidatus Puniceispirillaceae bacterium]
MHIAILLAGHTNKAMPQHFHDYHDMFTFLFQSIPNGKDFRFTTLAVVDDIFPNHLDDYDGYLISGSAYGVYDDAPFIARLMGLIRQIHQAKKPLFGVCFGHQIIAHALGGHAQKWDKGWVLGTIELTLTNLPDWIEENDWIDAKDKTIKLIHVHQDQVTKLPGGAQRIGTASHCKNAAFIIGDAVFAIQGHPEFDAPYTDALVRLLEDRAGKNHVRAARKSLSTPHDGQRVANWILTFFARHKPA